MGKLLFSSCLGIDAVVAVKGAFGGLTKSVHRSHNKYSTFRSEGDNGEEGTHKLIFSWEN